MELLNLVIVPHNGTVEVWSFVISGELPRTNKDRDLIDKAEAQMFQTIESYTGAQLDDEDKKDILDDGYYNGESFDIYLTWAVHTIQ